MIITVYDNHSECQRRMVIGTVVAITAAIPAQVTAPEFVGGASSAALRRC
jgi:hypothetical protein